jgi:hypothetical protein
MNACNNCGQCRQGRRPCATPEACEVPVDQESVYAILSDWSALLVVFLGLAVALALFFTAVYGY